MMGWTWALLAPVLLAGRIFPAEIQGPADAVISMTCPVKGLCLVLDASGGLLALDLAQRRWRLRGRHPELTAIEFSGLLSGHGKDSKGNLWRSNDGGRSFHPVVISPASGEAAPEPTASPGEIGLSISVEGVFLLAADGARQLIGLDCGAAWTAAGSAGFGFLLGGERGAVGLVLPEGSGKNEAICVSRAPAQVAVLRATTSGAFWLCSGAQVGRSTDGGGSFRQVAALDCLDISAMNGEQALALSVDGLYTLGKNGNARKLVSWRDARLSAAAVASGLLAVSGKDGFFARSLDGGGRWTLYHGPWLDAPRMLRFHDRRLGWLLDESGGLWETSDGGLLWSKKQDNVAAFATEPGGSRFIALQSGQIEQGEDEGAGRSFRAPLRLREFFAFDRRRLTVLGVDGRVLASGDGGSSWQEVGLPGQAPVARMACRTKPPRCVFADPAGHLYFGNPLSGR